MNESEKRSALKKRFVRSESVVHRQIAGESILVPIHMRVEESDAVFTLNEVATRFWELLNKNRTIEDISNLLLEEYDVPPQILYEDLIQLTEKLLHLDVISEA